MLLYYITDRTQFPGSEAERRNRLMETAVAAAEAGVEFIQLREKDLTARDLESMACQLMRRLEQFRRTRLLINSRIDVAIACGAQGVHLPVSDISASEARVIFSKAGLEDPVIACSCHTMAEVERADSHGANLAVFGPIFGKQSTGEQGSGKQSSGPAVGLSALREVCNRPVAAGHRMPVLALGGVTVENAAACLACAAAGVAGIRLFQTDDPRNVVTRLKESVTDAAEHTVKGRGTGHPYWPAPKGEK